MAIYYDTQLLPPLIDYMLRAREELAIAVRASARAASTPLWLQQPLPTFLEMPMAYVMPRTRHAAHTATYRRHIIYAGHIRRHMPRHISHALMLASLRRSGMTSWNSRDEYDYDAVRNTISACYYDEMITAMPPARGAIYIGSSILMLHCLCVQMCRRFIII